MGFELVWKGKIEKIQKLAFFGVLAINKNFHVTEDSTPLEVFHKYGIKIFELCEAKSGYIYNLEIYTGAHPTNSEHNTVISVLNRLCDRIKWKGHSVDMDRRFSSPKLFGCLWSCKTNAQ
jgi:hypothetical protein